MVELCLRSCIYADATLNSVYYAHHCVGHYRPSFTALYVTVLAADAYEIAVDHHVDVLATSSTLQHSSTAAHSVYLQVQQQRYNSALVAFGCHDRAAATQKLNSLCCSTCCCYRSLFSFSVLYNARLLHRCSPSVLLRI
jgi:hypothetical protein